jgi:hypothetical protein
MRRCQRLGKQVKHENGKREILFHEIYQKYLYFRRLRGVSLAIQAPRHTLRGRSSWEISPRRFRRPSIHSEADPPRRFLLGDSGAQAYTLRQILLGDFFSAIQAPGRSLLRDSGAQAYTPRWILLGDLS